MINNQVILIGKVADECPIRAFDSREGPKIAFVLATDRLRANRGSKAFELHRVVANASDVNVRDENNKPLISSKSLLLVKGELRHRYLVNNHFNSVEITEVFANSITTYQGTLAGLGCSNDDEQATKDPFYA